MQFSVFAVLICIQNSDALKQQDPCMPRKMFAIPVFIIIRHNISGKIWRSDINSTIFRHDHMETFKKNQKERTKEDRLSCIAIEIHFSSGGRSEDGGENTDVKFPFIYSLADGEVRWKSLCL